MSNMIPDSLINIPYSTAGERKLFDLLEEYLPEKCQVRYELLLGERDYRPDFTVIDPMRGVLIVEVKDWSVENIVGATQEQFRIKGYQGKSIPKPQLNPNRKCQIYLRNTREQLIAIPTLRNGSDRLLLQVNYCIAFPNINHREFSERNLDKLIPIDNVLFREDLIENGKPFSEFYDRLMQHLDTELSDEQIKAIGSALQPDIAIPGTMEPGFTKSRAGIVQTDKMIIDTYNLSLEQERIAKSLGEGPRLLRGIAGTGKTLIVLYRAKLMANDITRQNRILILCWNISLATYMRQVYNRLQIETGENQVIIYHFADFIRKFLNRNIDYDVFFDSTDSIEELEAVNVQESDKYDAIYIDEAQDFRGEWISFLFNNLLKGDDPKSRNLLISADDAQRIYNRRELTPKKRKNRDLPKLYQDTNFSWSKLGIPMLGRSNILKTIYRNSARVWIFSAFLLEDRSSYVKESTEEVGFFKKGNYDPLLLECSNLKAQVVKAIDIIQKMIKSGYAYNNVLILYRHKRFKGFHLIEYLKDKLQQKSIPHDWIAEDHQAKSIFEWEDNTVKISTVHSAKGMDSPIVIVLGTETFVQDLFDEQQIDEIRLLYVALTRAREFLVVLHSGNNGLVPNLKYCQNQYMKYRSAIINRIESQS